MAKKWILDKIIKQGTEYATTRRVYYVVKKVGTNSAGSARLVVHGSKLGYFDSEVAPLHKTSSNLLGLLDLKDEFIVIPPNASFSFEGDSGSKCRIVGEAYYLIEGETMKAEHSLRFKEQAKKYRTTYEGSFALGTDVAWGADVEYEILSLTPLTTEKVTLDDIVMVSITGNTVSEGDFAVEFFLDDKPLDLEIPDNLYRGIDVLGMPYPPADTTEMIAFTLKDMPIEVLGDHTLSIKVKNVSGADKAPASGSNWSVKVKLVAKYERTE